MCGGGRGVELRRGWGLDRGGEKLDMGRVKDRGTSRGEYAPARHTQPSTCRDVAARWFIRHRWQVSTMPPLLLVIQIPLEGEGQPAPCLPLPA